jgi:hypothetical protein
MLHSEKWHYTRVYTWPAVGRSLMAVSRALWPQVEEDTWRDSMEKFLCHRRIRSLFVTKRVEAYTRYEVLRVVPWVQYRGKSRSGMSVAQWMGDQIVSRVSMYRARDAPRSQRQNITFNRVASSASYPVLAFSS